MDDYNFVEVPLVGFTLAKSPFGFGYKEIFKKDFKVEVYLSHASKLKQLEGIVNSEANKGRLKTLFYGIGTAGTAATSSSAIASAMGLICTGGACPMWLGAMLASSMPFAWIPIVATGGFVVAKRLGGRRGLQKIAKSLPSEPKILDYTLITEAIRANDFEAKTLEYYSSKMIGTRKEKLKRMFSPDPKVKALKKDLTKGFETLVKKSHEMMMESSENKELYKAINRTYSYIHKGFKGSMFKSKGYILFGV